mmetsp:Transcript_71924/g.224256  ORF Transcript_71924/g.224256 Transcript_71924/m.224256 type:complete len:334 (+) Transcript_71924:967-1968(+)
MPDEVTEGLSLLPLPHAQEVANEDGKEVDREHDQHAGDVQGHGRQHDLPTDQHATAVEECLGHRGKCGRNGKGAGVEAQCRIFPEAVDRPQQAHGGAHEHQREEGPNEGCPLRIEPVRDVRFLLHHPPHLLQAELAQRGLPPASDEGRAALDANVAIFHLWPVRKRLGRVPVNPAEVPRAALTGEEITCHAVDRQLVRDPARGPLAAAVASLDALLVGYSVVLAHDLRAVQAPKSLRVAVPLEHEELLAFFASFWRLSPLLIHARRHEQTKSCDDAHGPRHYVEGNPPSLLTFAQVWPIQPTVAWLSPCRGQRRRRCRLHAAGGHRLLELLKG